MTEHLQPDETSDDNAGIPDPQPSMAATMRAIAALTRSLFEASGVTDAVPASMRMLETERGHVVSVETPRGRQRSADAAGEPLRP
jgi:hypothetical protein